jgi:tRNA (guanine37-N1)-methyltransferase
VPEVLLSGHHAEVARWRRAEAEAATRARRPDLWERHLRRGEPAAADTNETASAGRLDGHPAAA